MRWIVPTSVAIGCLMQAAPAAHAQSPRFTCSANLDSRPVYVLNGAVTTCEKLAAVERAPGDYIEYVIGSAKLVERYGPRGANGLIGVRSEVLSYKKGFEVLPSPKPRTLNIPRFVPAPGGEITLVGPMSARPTRLPSTPPIKQSGPASVKPKPSVVKP